MRAKLDMPAFSSLHLQSAFTSPPQDLEIGRAIRPIVASAQRRAAVCIEVFMKRDEWGGELYALCTQTAHAGTAMELEYAGQPSTRHSL